VTLALIVLLFAIVLFGVLQIAAVRQRVLVIGSTPLALEIVREIEGGAARWWTLVGVVADVPSPGPSWARHRVVGSLERLGEVQERLRPDRLIVAARDRTVVQSMPALVLAPARGMVVQDGGDAYEWLTGRVSAAELGSGAPVIPPAGVGSRLDAALRRGLSLVAALVGLVAAAPLLLVIAVAIKLDSRGPVLFRHDRLGLGDRRFCLLKFRTMHPVDGPTSEWVGDNQERITRVGRWLRRFWLDELPQFVNILRGDMSLVGPRPHPVSNAALFGGAIPSYPLRSTARPGITGWAQVRYGYANSLEEETEKMRYDLYYIKHRSLGLDLLILLETFGIVVLGRTPGGARQPRVSSTAGRGVHTPS
jgi:lipopolysaccharide/colanic/teichoic acid biosynthesis glycosyltransferase